jgi:regulator of nonsense transcripts 2
VRATRRTVFDTLYLLLAFGHESAAAAARLDPPGATFRIRLVCVLLGACGGYFCKGGAARRLDRFLAFLQRYLLAKPPLPLDVEFDVQARGAVPLPFCVRLPAMPAASASAAAQPEA